MYNMHFIIHTKTNWYGKVIILNVTKFHVNDLKDSNDISSLRGHLQAMDGVHAVRVDNLSNTITVEYESNLNAESLAAEIRKYKNTRQWKCVSQRIFFV